MGEPLCLGDILKTHLIQISEENVGSYWELSKIEQLLQRCKTTMEGEATSLYLEVIMLEKVTEVRDSWGEPIQVCNIVNGKNRTLSLYHLLVAVWSRLGNYPEKDHLRSRYVEYDSDSNTQMLKRNLNLDNGKSSGAGRFSYSDMMIDDDDEDDQYDSGAEFNSNLRFSYESLTRNSQFSTNIRLLYRDRLPEIIPDGIIISNYLRAVSSFLNIHLPKQHSNMRLYCRQLLWSLLKKSFFHVCYINRDFKAQLYRNYSLRAVPGIIERLNSQIIYTAEQHEHSMEHNFYSTLEGIYPSKDCVPVSDSDKKKVWSVDRYAEYMSQRINGLLFPDSDCGPDSKMQTAIMYAAGRFLFLRQTSDTMNLEDLYLCVLSDIVENQRKSFNHGNFDKRSSVSIFYKNTLSNQRGKCSNGCCDSIKGAMLEIIGDICSSYAFLTASNREFHSFKMDSMHSLLDLEEIRYSLSYVWMTKKYDWFFPQLMSFLCNGRICSIGKLKSSRMFNCLCFSLVRIWTILKISFTGKKLGISDDKMALKSMNLVSYLEKQAHELYYNVSNELEFYQFIKERLFAFELVQNVLSSGDNLLEKLLTDRKHNFTLWSETKFLLILYEFGPEVSQGYFPKLPSDLYFDTLSLEHILPKNPSHSDQNSRRTSDSDYSLVNSIGNIVISSSKANSSYSNKDFRHKQNSASSFAGGYCYRNSVFRSVRELGNSHQTEWNYTMILNRAKRISTFLSENYFHNPSFSN